jgi:hypothetical protein
MRFFDPHFDAASLFAGSKFNPRMFEHILGTLTDRWTILAGLESLRAPVLLAHGRYDHAVPFTMWDGSVAKVPNAHLHRFERRGHQLFFEEPVRFAVRRANSGRIPRRGSDKGASVDHRPRLSRLSSDRTFTRSPREEVFMNQHERKTA